MALAIALRRRRRLDEARARFINELAHDLRTPVTSLRLHAEMLSEGRVPAGEEARYLGVLGRETARLSSLLANLLDLSRVERGRRAFETQTLDVTEALAAAVGDFAVVHPKRAGDVTIDAADGLAVAADRTALARCLANLLDNAGKFTAPGTAIRVSAAKDAGRVRIVVADDGPGVAAADRARVFELYQRGSSAAASGAPGTGLGLALVRELVQGMRGVRDRSAGGGAWMKSGASSSWRTRSRSARRSATRSSRRATTCSPPRTARRAWRSASRRTRTSSSST
jgi:signal transduction histidine kinase